MTDLKKFVNLNSILMLQMMNKEPAGMCGGFNKKKKEKKNNRKYN